MYILFMGKYKLIKFEYISKFALNIFRVLLEYFWSDG